MLTDTKIAAMKGNAKTQTIRDSDYLFFLVTPAGKKGWRFRYFMEGKAKMMSLGSYPKVGLAEARRLRDQMVELVNQGIDPVVHRKVTKSAKENTLDAYFENWYAWKAPQWEEKHAVRNRRRYELHVSPFIGSTPITEITPPMIMTRMEGIQVRGTIETAHRVLGVLKSLFRYAVVKGDLQLNPAAGVSEVMTPSPERHYPAPINAIDIQKLLPMIWYYPGSIVVQTAIRMGVYLFVRPGELRHMKWEDIDGNLWRRKVTKIKTELFTPLPRQVMALLEILRPITGHGIYVFPSARSVKGERAMSEVAVLAAYRRSGVTSAELVGHSWRAAARTVCDEVLKFRPDVIEHALGHKQKDSLGNAYNRTTHLEERTKLAQAWADWLDELRLK